MLDLLKHNTTIMNRLNKEARAKIIAALVEGNFIRATSRMCGVAFNTVLKLLPEIGKACAEYQQRVFRNLPSKRIQCDEIWAFCYSKQKNVPAEFLGCRSLIISGSPKAKDISTSYVERQNLTIRMGMRCFTRLTNGFSKKIENHFYAVAIHCMHYNSCRIHKTLRVTPAMEAGTADHVWTTEEMLDRVCIK